MTGRSDSADVLVVGAGIMGASVAWQLRRLGMSVHIIERADEPATGSTARATGGFRAQYASAINVQLSLLSLQLLSRFREDTGVDAEYRPVGYLFLAGDARQLAQLDGARKAQAEAGLPDTRLVSPEEAQRLSPGISVDGVVGGTYGPRDGYIRPLQILKGFLDGALRSGARMTCGVSPVRFERSGDRITSVHLSNGARLETAHVVNAAGAWAAGIALMAGTQIEVEPVRRQVAMTVETDALAPTTPMTIFTSDGFHFRVRDGRVLLLWPVATHGATPDDITFDSAWLDGIESRMRTRIPALAGVAIDRPGCWCGLYEMSPDQHALLGKAPGLDNLWCINGSSGHGVMHSPALGLLLAQQVAGLTPALDTTALDPARFRRGEPNPAPVLL